jgi:hypothetical protein
MVSHLDDWLLFSEKPLNVTAILNTISSIGLQINKDKSILRPTSLIYLGLHIDTRQHRLVPTASCIQHLRYLAPIISKASRQDLRRIAGYIAWLCFAMSRPAFLASTVL